MKDRKRTVPIKKSPPTRLPLYLLVFPSLLMLVSVLFIIPTLSFAKDKSKVVDLNFDIRTETQMSAAKFDELFHDSKLEGQGENLIKLGKKHGVNVGFAAGIMAQETGWGRNSSMLTKWNNPGGLTCAGATPPSGANYSCEYSKPPCCAGRYWKNFKNVDDALDEKIAYLKRKYIDQGVYTITKVQKIYCPDGDNCDDWAPGVIAAMKMLGEDGSGGKMSGSGSEEEDTKTSEEKAADAKTDAVVIPPSLFKKYDMYVKTSGVKKKINHDTRYITYETNTYIKKIINGCLLAVRVIAIILTGYITLLWLVILLARNGVPFTYELTKKLTNGKLDAHEPLANTFKITVVGYFILVLISTGMLAKIFQGIYSLILLLLNYLTYGL